MTLCTAQQLLEAASGVPTDTDGLDANCAIVSLCHHFDCPHMLSRVEDNMLLLLGELQSVRGRPMSGVQVAVCLQYAVSFGLQRVKRSCMSDIAATCRSTRHRSETESEAQWKYLEKRSNAGGRKRKVESANAWSDSDVEDN